MAVAAPKVAPRNVTQSPPVTPTRRAFSCRPRARKMLRKLIAPRVQVQDLAAAGDDATRPPRRRILSFAESRRRIMLADRAAKAMLTAGEKSLPEVPREPAPRSPRREGAARPERSPDHDRRAHLEGRERREVVARPRRP